MHTLLPSVCRAAAAALVVLFASQRTVLAGDTDDLPASVISVNPAGLALLHFQIDYERVIRAGASCFGQPIGFHHAH